MMMMKNNNNSFVNTNTGNNRREALFYAVRTELALGTVESLLPGNEAVNMHPQQWETVSPVGSVQRSKIKDERRYESVMNPCGGGVEYLHRYPASRRRRRKEKSQNRDSKMWSRVPRDSDPRKTALARASSIYKGQTRPLVREGAQKKKDRNCQTVINMWASTPRLTD
jgi:hypothetical protein